MSKSFTKLFSSITESTVWGEPATTRVAWVTMLAMADRFGRVWASVPGLARRANVTLEECQTALNCFLGPDLHSRTPEHEGRRIEPIDGGWKLLNYEKYRETQDEEAKAEGNAERQRRFRAKNQPVPRGTVTESNASNAQSQPVTPNNPIAEAEAEALKKKDSAASRLEGFLKFWALWPKRVAKADALKAWTKIAPDAALQFRILAAVALQLRSADWTRDNGKFIPHPATWLNGRRWEDETPPPRGADGIGAYRDEALA